VADHDHDDAQGAKAGVPELGIAPAVAPGLVPTADGRIAGASAASGSPHPPEPPSSALRTTGFIALGVGALGILAGVGTAIGLAANDAHIDAECPDLACTSEGLDAVETSRALFPVNTASFIVGAIGLAVGAPIVLATGSSSRSAVTAGATLLPGGGWASLGARF
jgi:hypothetical protein